MAIFSALFHLERFIFYGLLLHFQTIRTGQLYGFRKVYFNSVLLKKYNFTIPIPINPIRTRSQKTIIPFFDFNFEDPFLPLI